MKLFSKGYNKHKVQEKVELFFKAYDFQKDEETRILRQKLEAERKMN